jgi:hypothetical protein
MMTPKISDAKLVAGIRAATAAWNAPQDTTYYAARFGMNVSDTHARLMALCAAGVVERHGRARAGRAAHTWTVVDDATA